MSSMITTTKTTIVSDTLTLRTLDDLDELEKLALIRMSYSRLNTFDMCQAMYFYQYISKEEDEFGEAAVTGNVIHSVLEDHVGTPLDFDEMLVSFDKHRGSYDPTGKIGPELIDAGREMIGEFVDRHEGETFNIVGKELPFELIIGSGFIRGFIDLVTRDANGALKISDYKSGKWEVAKKDVPDNLQLGIYALAVSQKFPGEDVYAELYYLRSGHRRGHLFKAEDMVKTYERVLEKINLIISRPNFTPVSEGKGYPPCGFCSFAKPDICKIGFVRKEKRERARKKKK